MPKPIQPETWISHVSTWVASAGLAAAPPAGSCAHTLPVMPKVMATRTVASRHQMRLLEVAERIIKTSFFSSVPKESWLGTLGAQSSGSRSPDISQDEIRLRRSVYGKRMSRPPVSRSGTSTRRLLSICLLANRAASRSLTRSRSLGRLIRLASMKVALRHQISRYLPRSATFDYRELSPNGQVFTHR